MFGIDDAIAAGSNLINTVITRVWPDATELERLKLEKVSQEIQAEYSVILGQLEINKVEAAHPSLFVAGARPFILWGTGLSLILSGFHWLLDWLALCFDLPSIPVPDSATTTGIVTSLLGLGGLRSADKYLGTDTKQMKESN